MDFVVVVQTTNPGEIGCNYTLSVTGDFCSGGGGGGGGGAFTACFVDDASGDTFSIDADPTSMTYGQWEYFVVATSTAIDGTADYVSYVPGRSLIAYDHTDTAYTMDANFNLGAKSGTTTVLERVTRVRHVLRDRNTANDPPCGGTM